MKDQSRKEITGLARLAEDLGRHAAGRNDPINEAYLQGIAAGLLLAELLICNEAQFMSRWGRFLPRNKAQSARLSPLFCLLAKQLMDRIPPLINDMDKASLRNGLRISFSPISNHNSCGNNDKPRRFAKWTTQLSTQNPSQPIS